MQAAAAQFGFDRAQDARGWAGLDYYVDGDAVGLASVREESGENLRADVRDAGLEHLVAALQLLVVPGRG
jgi:hypothetical protein